MHDPMVVAHEVKVPIPKRRGAWTDKHYKGRRWGWTRAHFTGSTKPLHSFWRPAAWTFALAGRVYGWRLAATIWHVEPNGADSGTVCKHRVSTQNEDGTWNHRYPKAWRWHVWHWHIQIPPLQELRARLFDRCAECGRKGRPDHSMQWNGKRVGWQKWRSREGLYHAECASLVHLRRGKTDDEALIRHIFAAYRVAIDQGEVEALSALTAPGVDALPFHQERQLWTMLGYERGEGYRLVPTGERR